MTTLTCNDLYKEVKNWSDMINTNIDFMNGKIDRTFYHGGPLDDETLDKRNKGLFLNQCIELNKLQLFTYCSQPYRYYEDEEDETICDYHQKSYVYFLCEPHIGPKLYKELLKDERVFISYENYTLKTMTDNFDTDLYVVTRQRITPNRIIFYEKYKKIEVDGYYHHSHWYRDYLNTSNRMECHVKKFPIMHEMLSNCCNIVVVCKNDESAPEIVLDIMKKIIL